jgi:hypothetical protein
MFSAIANTLKAAFQGGKALVQAGYAGLRGGQGIRASIQGGREALRVAWNGGGAHALNAAQRTALQHTGLVAGGVAIGRGINRA